MHILDHLNRKQLIEKYKVHGVNLDAIEEVDFIWQGESFSELIGVTKHYDWIIASHLIEHTPDLIGFLNDCDAILKDDGVISLVVPDLSRTVQRTDKSRIEMLEIIESETKDGICKKNEPHASISKHAGIIKRLIRRFF